MIETAHIPTWVLAFMALLLVHSSQQLQPSQYDALLRIKQQLNFPPELSSWSDNADFCNIVPNPSLTLICYEGNITQLHVVGNSFFPQFSQDFSVSAFFSNLGSFPNLKVLSLVSLGLKGPLPQAIGALSSLEIMNVSSNLFNGSIPKEISYLKSLQSLILEHNKFTGELPDWIGTLPLLSVLSLKNNLISGSLPRSLSALESLRTLVLSSNLLSGEVPNLQNLTNLQVLDLENNTFGPHFPGLPSKLVSLVLKRNNFSYVELYDFSHCYQLQKLDASLNQFVGPFPSSLFSLPSLTYLDVAGNKLTGRLSKNMSCNEMLTFVNLSTNRLTGELPSCLIPKHRNSTILYGGNCLSKRYPEQAPESFCHNEALAVRVVPQKQEKRSHGKGVLVLGIIGGIIGGVLLLGLAFVIVRKEYAKKQMNKVPHTRLIVEKVSPALTLNLLKDASYISETRRFGKLGLPPYRTFVFDELKEATNNFAAENLIGEGTHGQVYKGWMNDGTVAAIRCLKMRKKRGVQSYTRQLELIAKLRHRNLVGIFGHCFECCRDDSYVSKILLVLEYVPNGTLRSFISEAQASQKFSWTQRLTAVIGIAKGIQFLHTGTVPGMFSNDLKITDVLLDHDYHVKISKYNHPLLAETTSTEVNFGASSSGTKPIPSERRKYGEKDDVYDFGVILLEVIVGRTISSQSDIDASKNIISSSACSDEVSRRAVVDPSIHKECSNASLKTVMCLCLKCLLDVPPDRPSVEDVIWNLQFAAQVQDSWRRDGYNSNQGSPAHLS